MKKMLVIVCVLLVIGISSFGIYYYLSDKDVDTPRGTFVMEETMNEDEENECHHLFKSSQTNKFV